MLLTALLFILILSILVLIHEFGHFYAAKRVGVHVEEFGFGLPPKVFGKKIRGTIYSLNLLPFGGFVKLLGEDETDQSSVENARKNPQNFMSKTPLQKTAIIVAGVFMNTVLAVAIYYVFFLFTGFRSFSVPNYFDYNFRFGQVHEQNTVIMGYGDVSPAKDAAINLGEAVTQIDGVEVRNIEDIHAALKYKVNEEVTVVVKDMRSLNQPERVVVLKPASNEIGDGILGVYLGKSVTLDYTETKLVSGPLHAYNVYGFSIYSFGKLIKSSFIARDISPVSSSVSGPVGIFSIVGGILDYSRTLPDPSERLQMAILGILDLTALFSVSLAFLNIMPFPALDGGRLLFIGVEKLIGKPLSPKVEATFHKFGMVLLLALLVLVTIRDVGRIIN